MRTLKKYIVCTAIMSLALTGCTDEQVLDLKPIGSLPESIAFSTREYVVASVEGMYQSAQIGYYNGGGGRGYIWGAAVIQQNDMRGEDVVNTQQFYQITYQNSQDPTGAANTTYYWVDGYRLINRCNIIIDGVQTAANKGIITQTEADDYVGQAKFLRAITHFEMLNFFAKPYGATGGETPGIPYRDYVINTADGIELSLAEDRSTVKENYVKILADLNDAENLITTTSLVKSSANAAIGFKAKVKLHMQDWQGALAEVAKLEGQYTLTSEPWGVFDNNSSNTESIFSIANSAAVNPSLNGAIASQYKRRQLGVISPIIWNDSEWTADDKRRNSTTSITDNVDNLVYKVGDDSYTTNKYRDTDTYSDYTPILRYAEILLIKAEAEARVNGVSQVAVDALNAVRNRAIVSASAYTTSSFSSTADFVAKVIKERRIEFLMEGKRWADIHRLQQDPLGAPVAMDGIPAKYKNGFPGITSYTIGTPPPVADLLVNPVPYSDFKFIWPIPSVETIYNPNVPQNPGY